MGSSHQYKLEGLKENNLKDIDLSFSHDQFVVVCGPSGSGKSTLAFDTIYAEGARRYTETFEPYTRQFLDRLPAPDAESISQVRPGLALQQRNQVTSSRSTIGTVTEINDYLKLLWARLAQLHCPECGEEVIEDTPEEIVAQLEKKKFSQLIVGFEISYKGYSSIESFIETLEGSGLIRFYNESSRKIERLSTLSSEEISGESILIALDRFKCDDGFSPQVRSRLISSLYQAYSLGRRNARVVTIDKDNQNTIYSYSQSLECAHCNKEFTKPSPSLFTFNSPIGACSECNGFGKVLEIDFNKCIPDTSLSIAEDVIHCWRGEAGKPSMRKLREFLSQEKVSVNTPWTELPERIQDAIWFGETGRKGFIGILPWFKKLEQKRHKMHVRIFIARYRGEVGCKVCHGSRLVEEAMYYSIDGKNLADIYSMAFEDLLVFIEKLTSIPKDLEPVVTELGSRVKYLNTVGLSYLTLDRRTKTLSGGEYQRVNLTSILGARIMNSTIVLDEPTIGLHPRDTENLLKSIRSLSDHGNSLVVVEHDPDVISSADEIIELGPEAGAGGGEIVFKGDHKALIKAKTKTAQYFKNVNSRKTYREKRESSGDFLRIEKASKNNLKSLSVEIPLGMFVTVVGVSGSGKSTLLHDVLYTDSKKYFESSSTDLETNIEGLDLVSEIVLIDQTPIGKTNRANAATYTKVWEHFREYLAQTEAAVRLGLSKSSFSFNVDGGRCPVCKGNGSIKVEMQFLTDVTIECESCLGRRFQDEILNINLKGSNVIEILDMTVDEAINYTRELPDEKRNAAIVKGLQPLVELGLGYLKLGQPLSNLSGGEAQRLKLASYLAKKSKLPQMFILDEPTTGLHPSDIERLIDTFHLLVDQGHSVVCIEHNLDVIKYSDWMIELGPGGGHHGGELVLEGVPQKLIKETQRSSETLIHLRKKISLSTKTVKKKKVSKNRSITIAGAREHNLKNISLDLPLGELVVVTGVSGSGKSTLAFDILFSEGQRRFLDCLSPYARQFLNQKQKPEVDYISGIPPTVAISQKTSPPSGVSTLGTITEVYQYLRLLYSKVGVQHCIDDGAIVSQFSIEDIVDELIKTANGKRIYLFAPVVSGRKGHYRELFERALSSEIYSARVDDDIITIEEGMKLDRHKLHWVSLLVGEVKVSKKSKEILSDAISQALLLSSGTVEVSVGDKYSEPIIFNTERVCPECKKGYLPLDPQDFSFRSKRGQCKTCLGFGYLEDGALSKKTCKDCSGSRLAEIGRSVKISGKTISEVSSMTAPELFTFLDTLKLDKRLEPITLPVLKELKGLLEMIGSIGLGYLSIDRDASTLSSGEAQRLRLAKSLGAPLTDTCYILDEPSVGLHSKDHAALMKILRDIRDQGNTVVVVEHDEDTIRQADYVIDIGPQAGVRGGEVIASGNLEKLLRSKKSLTAKALHSRTVLPEKSYSLNSKSEKIKLTKANANNLKNVNVSIPVGALSVVCGVSGAGKSSLVHSTVVPAFVEDFEGEKERQKYYKKTWSESVIPDSIQKFVEIDQKPIGRTPASTPASFLGVFDDIRKIMAQLPESQARGFDARFYSYNTGGGKCPACEGKGFIKVPMSFLPDAITTCEVCHGDRYRQEAMEVRFKGFSIADILKLSISESVEIFKSHKKIHRMMTSACDMGIGYLTLGQASRTLSGGEAQRLKLVRELQGASNTLFVLDEPTIGLHMIDVDRLISVLYKLVEAGNTVVVIEHNLDVIRAADYVIDIGPGPSSMGGKILFQGSQEQYMLSKKHTPTLEELKKYIMRSGA